MSRTHALVLLLEHVLVHDVLLLQQHLLMLLRGSLLRCILRRCHARLWPSQSPTPPRTCLQALSPSHSTTSHAPPRKHEQECPSCGQHAEEASIFTGQRCVGQT